MGRELARSMIYDHSRARLHQSHRDERAATLVGFVEGAIDFRVRAR